MNTSFLAQLSQQFAHFSGQLSCLLAEYILAGLIFVLLLGSFVFRLAFSRLIEGLCWLGLCMNVAAVVYTPLVADIGWEMLVQDGMARYLKVLFGMTTMAVILFEKWHRPPQKSPSLEWHILVIGLLLGAHFMVMAKHLLMMYIGMEIVSICSYLLAGMRKKERFAAEAGMKYLLFGAFSSAMMLYGISWLYGSTGSFTLDVDFYLQFGKIPLLTQTLILLLFLSGFWFKISIVPFHFWTPEVYEGVRYPTAAYFSTIPKVAGIGMLIRFMGMMGSCSTCTEPLLYVLAFLSILTMTWGNIAALAQKSGKRLLAFSAIAHSGFLLMLLLPHSKMGYTAALYYVGIYTLMNFLAFFVLGMLAASVGRDKISHFSGLANTFPALTILLIISMLAMIGLPPSAGFIAKWYGLLAVWESWEASHNPIWMVLLIAAAINTVIALTYYLRIPSLMIFGKQTIPAHPIPQSVWVHLLAFALGIPLILLGIWKFDSLWGFLWDMQ